MRSDRIGAQEFFRELLRAEVIPGEDALEIQTQEYPKTPRSGNEFQAVNEADRQFVTDCLARTKTRAILLREILASNPAAEGTRAERFESKSPDELTGLIDEAWPAWSPGGKAAAQREARELLLRRCRGYEQYPSSRSIQVFFPVVFKRNGVAVDSHLVRVFVHEFKGTPGTVILSPGSLSPPGLGRHSVLTRTMDEESQEAFARAAARAYQDVGGAESKPALEVFVDGADPDGDAAFNIMGPSLGLAIYTAVRSFWSGVQLRESWCLSGDVPEHGDGLVRVQEGNWKHKAVVAFRSKNEAKQLKTVFHAGRDCDLVADLDFNLTELDQAYSKVTAHADRVMDFLQVQKEAFEGQQFQDLAGKTLPTYAGVQLWAAKQVRVTRAPEPREAKQGEEGSESSSGQRSDLNPGAEVRGNEKHSEAETSSNERQRVRLNRSIFNQGITFLRGAPGLGKSFALRRLFCEQVEHFKVHGGLIPVHVHLPKVNSEAWVEPELASVLAATATGGDLNHRDAIAQELQQGRVVLFADSLDELSEQDRKVAATRLIAWQKERSPDRRLVLAGRQYGFDSTDIPADLSAPWLDVEPLDRKARRAVTQAACGGNDEALELAERLVKGEGLESVLEVPFLLVVLCLLATNQDERRHLEGREHISPAYLLSRAVEHLKISGLRRANELARAKDRKVAGIEEEWSWDAMGRAALRGYHLAVCGENAQRNYVRAVPRNTLETMLRENGAPQSDGDLVAYVGWFLAARVLTLVGPQTRREEQRYEAAHRQIWEFLAGQELAKQIVREEGSGEWIEWMQQVAWSPAIEEVVVFACDCLSNVWLGEVSDGMRRDRLAEITRALYGEPYNNCSLQKLRRWAQENLSRRRKYVDKLDQLGNRAGLVYRCLVDVSPKYFTEEMKKIVWEIREWRMAELWFGRTHDDFEMLQTTSLARSRSRIALVENSLKSSLCLSKMEEEPEVSSEMLLAMQLWPSSVTLIWTGGTSHKQRRLIGFGGNAVSALGVVNAFHERFVDQCYEILELLSVTRHNEDSFGKIRGGVATALGTLGGAHEGHAYQCYELLEQLSNTSPDQDDFGRVRRDGATALGVLGVAHEHLAASCLTILKRLCQTTNNQDRLGDIRGSAAIAVGEVGAFHERFVDQCYEILELLSVTRHNEDSVGKIRGGVATALGTLGGAHEGHAYQCYELLEQLSSTSPDQDDFARVRRDGATALGVLGAAHEHLAASCLTILKRLCQAPPIQNRDVLICPQAATALGTLGAAYESLADDCWQTVARLAQNQDDSGGWMRRGAATALGVLGAAYESLAPQCMGILERLAQTAQAQEKISGWVRKEAATALGAIGGSWPTVAEQAFRAVNPLLGDPSSDVRAKAAESLAKIVRLCPTIASECEISLHTNDRGERAKEEPKRTEEELQHWWSACGECYRHLFRMFRTGELGEDNPNQVSKKSGRYFDNSGKFKNLGGVPRDVRRAARNFRKATQGVSSRSSEVWLIHRFWQPICTGPSDEAMRLFEKRPPGKGFYHYLRTIDELTAGAKLPAFRN